MPDLEYKIKTIADLQAAEKSKATFEATNKVLKEQGKESALVTQKLKELDRALSTDSAQALKLADSLNKVAIAERSAGRSAKEYIVARDQAMYSAGLKAPGRLQEMALAFGGAGGGIGGIGAAARTLGPQAAVAATVGIAAIKLGKTAAAEFAEGEESLISMQAAMASAGVLTDAYSEKLQQLASDYQTLTGLSDEAWQGVLTRLTQFGATPETIDKNAEAVKNLAGVLDGDLQTAAMMVGKAMRGEFTAFSRLGIEFDEHATKAENLQHLYEELAQRGGGMLEARMTSLIGKSKAMKNAFSDLMEAGGGVGLRMIFGAQGMDIMTTAMDFWAKKLQAINPSQTNLQNALKKTVEAMDEGVEEAKKFAEELDEVKKSADDAAASLQKYFQELSQRTKLDQQEDEAMADLKLAEIKRKEKSGELKPSEARIEEHRVKENLERSKLSREDGMRNSMMETLAESVNENILKAQTADLKAGQEEAKLKQYFNEQKRANEVGGHYDKSINMALARGDKSGAERLTAEKGERVREIHANNGDVNAQRVKAQQERKDAEKLKEDLFKKNADYLQQINALDQEQRQGGRIHELQKQRRGVDTATDVQEMVRKEKAAGRTGTESRAGGGGSAAGAEELETVPFTRNQPLGGRPVRLDRPVRGESPQIASAQSAIQKQEQYWLGILDALLKMGAWMPAHDARYRQAISAIERIDAQQRSLAVEQRNFRQQVGNR